MHVALGMVVLNSQPGCLLHGATWRGTTLKCSPSVWMLRPDRWPIPTLRVQELDYMITIFVERNGGLQKAC